MNDYADIPVKEAASLVRGAAKAVSKPINAFKSMGPLGQAGTLAAVAAPPLAMSVRELAKGVSDYTSDEPTTTDQLQSLFAEYSPNLIGGAAGGIGGYLGSKLLNSDPDEAGITPEERKARQAANRRRTALLTLGTAGIGASAPYLNERFGLLDKAKELVGQADAPKTASFTDRLGQAVTYGVPAALLGGLGAGYAGYSLAPEGKLPLRAGYELFAPGFVDQMDKQNLANKLLLAGTTGGLGALGLGGLGALYGFSKKPKKEEAEKEARATLGTAGSAGLGAPANAPKSYKDVEHLNPYKDHDLNDAVKSQAVKYAVSQKTLAAILGGLGHRRCLPRPL